MLYFLQIRKKGIEGNGSNSCEDFWGHYYWGGKNDSYMGDIFWNSNGVAVVPLTNTISIANGSLPSMGVCKIHSSTDNTVCIKDQFSCMGWLQVPYVIPKMVSVHNHKVDNVCTYVQEEQTAEYQLFKWEVLSFDLGCLLWPWFLINSQGKVFLWFCVGFKGSNSICDSENLRRKICLYLFMFLIMIMWIVTIWNIVLY